MQENDEMSLEDEFDLAKHQARSRARKIQNLKDENEVLKIKNEMLFKECNNLSELNIKLNNRLLRIENDYNDLVLNVDNFKRNK